MMKKVRPWVEALGIPEDDYQRWCLNIPAAESVTFRCLREGRIPVEAYLDWACNHYELPVLKKDFFANAPDHTLFEKLKSIGSWSNEIMPIGEWDGVIYIACTEPNDDISWSFNVCYLLAAPASLEAHWKALNATKPVLAPTVATPSLVTPPLPPMAEITKTAFPVLPNIATPDKKDDPFAAIEMQLTQTAVKIPEASAAPALDMPEGFGAVGTFAPAPALDVPDAFAALAPEGISHEATPAVNDVVPEGLSLPDMPENTLTAIVPKADVSISPAPVTSQDLNTMQKMAQEYFKELKSDFVGCMLLSFDGDNLRPIAWDEKWKTTGPNTAFISLSNASAFRVVYRTKMPYLGHVVETPSNSEFFSAWGFTALPENILVQPLSENGQWYGMLLLLADKTKKQSTQLAVAEQVAARLANVMGKATKKAA